MESENQQLTKCKVCGQSVAKQAQTCPHCGIELPGYDIRCPNCNSATIRLSQKGDLTP